jgi:tripartite-type tricarboxylate transporter receptor subunit TctC
MAFPHQIDAKRRRMLAIAATTPLLLNLSPGYAQAPQTAGPYAGKVLRILVGFPPGGGTDAIARMLGERLKEELGATVVVENRAGAGGQLAAQALKAAAPDGLTLMLSHDHTVSILPLVVKTPGFDPAKDFMPVAGFASFVNAFALAGGTPARSFAEYAAWVKSAGGGKGAVGIPAPASTPEFMVRSIAQAQKLDLVPAPYRGSAPMMADMLGNQIAAGVGSVPDFIENHKAGKLRVVAVGGTQRQAVMPDVPTLAEVGIKGFEDVPYYGLFAPAGTPAAMTEAVSAALAKVLDQASVRERLTSMGLAVGHMPAQVLASREKAYATAWAGLIRASGFVPQ